MGDEFDLSGRLRVDFSELEEIPERTEAAVEAADGQQIGIRTEVDDRQATRSFRDTDRAIAKLDRAVARPKIEVDGSQADRTIADLRARFAALDPRLEKLKAAEAASAATGLRGLGVAGSLARAAPVAVAAALPIAAIAAGGKQLIDATVPRTLESAKMEKSVTRNFGGAQGQEFLAASRALSEATGFLANDFRAAAIAGKSLAAMSDDPAKAALLQTEAIKQLLPVAADIAATSPDKALQTVAGAFTTMKAAIAGSASAQQSLRMDLSDTYMQTKAFGGALRNTWAALSEAEQAQYRYREMLAQTKDVMGEAGDETSLEFQMRSFNKQTGDLAEALGTELIPMMTGLIRVVNQLVDAIPDRVPKVIGAVVKAGYEVQRFGLEANPVTAPFASGIKAAIGAGDKAKAQTSVLSGATAHATERPDYYSAEPPPVQVNLNVRREPGTTINLDTASWEASNQ